MICKFILVTLLTVAAISQAAEYGQKVKYTEGQPLIFPDGELVFLGRQRTTFPRLINYKFQMTSQGKIVDVFWKTVGIISPVFFKVGGEKFVLELDASKAFKGFLKNDELVLWKESDFNKKSSVNTPLFQ